jgi:hypothetical protein
MSDIAQANEITRKSGGDFDRLELRNVGLIYCPYTEY